MRARSKIPAPPGEQAERPSASPPHDKTSSPLPYSPSEACARNVNREEWRDEVWLGSARLVGELGPMLEWQQRVDLAKLAVEIAGRRQGATPQSCIREASELLLAAREELEWMDRGKNDEESTAREKEALRGIEEILNTPDPNGWDELVPWDRLCYEGRSERPKTLVFPDGLTFEAYSRKNRLKELVLKYHGHAKHLEQWMAAAEKGGFRLFDLHGLARFRAKSGVSNKVT